ncbi:hypothetical protein PF586_10080 [Lactobacillus delbrueckii]|uniref:Uncharacterized protein n=2 Tax=Lactobacillus delbrueckii TaxID=1584 RepID=A0AAW5YYU9_9LACO|nr:hypothetical protein [Lactobacillus delbrueckii]MDA3768735.1 hypothetical protein [Lactobacillus delbrueckii]
MQPDELRQFLGKAGVLEFKIRMRWLASQKKSSFVYIVTSEHYQE